ncbi:hypothetical protein BASA60_000597 [Batrachochytrium salamandrivorans]|nr:hypothetical protein BASA60_000597 [Batrachochytrium salamandrivorans]
MLVSFVIALLTISHAFVSATNYATYNLLKNDRAAGHLIFPPTTLAQKKVWANYGSKKSHYGPAADPFPIAKKLRENIDTVTDEELQLGITDAFARIRDHHTRWTNMAPYRCFYATTGVTFTFIEGDPDITKKPTVVVTSTAKSSELLALFGEDYSKIKAGDELLAIDRLSFVKCALVLNILLRSMAKVNRLPSEDFITFQFKSRANPEIIHTVNVPYASGHDEECWELGSKLYKSLLSRALPGTPETSLPVSAEQPGDSQESDTAHLSPESHKTDSPEDSKREAAIEKRSNFGQESVVSMNPTDVTKITWGIYKPESTNMGIIKLDSFDPEEIGIKGLAVQKAVMIIRSLLANELKDTNRSCLSPPMGVFNDAMCYSSCEVFSGSIQGHDAGIIFGEDVGFTKTVRTGRYNGQTIEDAGIEPDTVFRPQWSDLQPNPTTNTQYARIAASLVRIGRENGQSKLHFVSEPFEIDNPPLMDSHWKLRPLVFHEFIVFRADGATVAAQQKVATDKQKFSISVSAAGSTLGNN